MKKTIAMLLSCGLIFSLTACGGSGTASEAAPASEPAASESTAAEDAGEETAAPAEADADAVTFICAHTSTADSTKGVFVQAMADWINENTTDLRMEVYPAGQLGSDTENAESVVDNTIQMTLGATGNFVNSIPELAVFDTPFAFDNYEQITNAFNDEEFKASLDKALEANGVTTVGLRLEGFRTLFSNVPVKHFEDVKGLQIRVMDSQNLINLWKCLGASPTTVAYTELYTALQQGVVQAQENTSISTLTNYNLFEVTKYATVTKHNYTCDFFIANLDWYNSLTDQQKQEIADGFAYAKSTENSPEQNEEETHEKFKADYGYEVYAFTDEDIEKCREATQSVREDIQKQVSPEIYQAYMDVIEKYKN